MKTNLTASLILFIVIFTTPLKAEMAVIVNPGNPVGELSKKEVKDIYLGKKKKFPGGDSAIPIDQETEDLRSNFINTIIGKDLSQLRSYWSRKIFTGKGQPPKQVGGDEEVLKLVRENPAIIGYIEAGSVDDTVKVVHRY